MYNTTNKSSFTNNSAFARARDDLHQFKNNDNNEKKKKVYTNHVPMQSCGDSDSETNAAPITVTGRRRPPDHLVALSGRSANNQQSITAPWAESAPCAPAVSTSYETYQSGQDRDKNFRKHLRTQFRQYHLEHLIPDTLQIGEDDLTEDEKRREDQQDQEYEQRKKKFSKNKTGTRDLKMTTLPNYAKKFGTLPRDDPGHSGTCPQFSATIDEIGQESKSNRKSSTNLHNANKKTRLQPSFYYEDEVSHLPALPTVGITFTGDRAQDTKEVVFPWDRPRVDANGAARLARREHRRLVTQRRLEFAEQFLPEVCSGVTTKMSNRVAEQYLGGRNIEGQPVPTTTVPSLEMSSLRGVHAGANPLLGAKGVTSSTNIFSPKNVQRMSLSDNSNDSRTDGKHHRHHHHQTKNASDIAASGNSNKKKHHSHHHHHHKSRRSEKAKQIKNVVDDIVRDHEGGLQSHELLMAITSTKL